MSKPQPESYREIILTKGRVTLVSVADYKWLSPLSWYTQGPMRDGRCYAARRVTENGVTFLSYMHREILGLKRGDKRQGDHKEPHATLDNRRSNLRIATQAQNLWNCVTKKHSGTGLKGAYPRRGGGKNFWSHITINGKVIYLGQFETAQEAHAAYCEAAKKYHGKFARFK